MSKFSDKEFILLNRAKDLYIYTSEAVGNEKVIPRRRRYPTGQRLETMAMEILQKCHLANTTDLHRAFEERQRLQTEVIALCLTLEQLIDALKASKAYPGINQHKADIWIQHSLDVRYLCAASTVIFSWGLACIVQSTGGFAPRTPATTTTRTT